MAIKNVYPEGKYFAVSFPNLEEWRAQSKTLSQIVALTVRNMTWTGSASPESLNVD